MSITSPTHILLTNIASDAYGIFMDIDTVDMVDYCAVRSSYQCQTSLPEAMQQGLAQLQHDVSDLVSSGVLAGYSYYSPIASDLRDVQDDTNQLPNALGQEIGQLESGSPGALSIGTQVQADASGIDNSALAIRNALTTT